MVESELNKLLGLTIEEDKGVEGGGGPPPSARRSDVPLVRGIGNGQLKDRKEERRSCEVDSFIP
jgi:hypothetical protein